MAITVEPLDEEVPLSVLTADTQGAIDQLRRRLGRHVDAKPRGERARSAASNYQGLS